MFAEVSEALLDRPHRREPASLAGFARYALDRYPFPAIVAEDEGRVEGVLLFDLNELEIRLLDDFELDIYERIARSVGMSNGHAVDADVFVLKEGHKSALSNREWNAEVFERSSLQVYLRQVIDWKSNYRSRN